MNNSSFRLGCRLATCLAFAALFAHHASAQSLYMVSKAQLFYQTVATGPVADPLGAYAFSARAATNVTLALPSGAAQALAFSSGENAYTYSQVFSTKAALDAAFANGTYRMTGPAVPTLTLNLATELYPSGTIAVAGGTWVNGLLVLNPAQANTINLTASPSYGSAGALGHMQTAVSGLFDNVNLENDVATLAVFGIRAQSTPLTTIAIPAGTMTSGRVYEAEVQTDIAATLDATTVAGGGIISLWSNRLRFFIAAQATGTTTPAPVVAVQPSNQSAAPGGTATIPLAVTLGGSSSFNNVAIRWYFNGTEVRPDGGKYSFAPGSFGLLIRNLTTADAGNYYAILVSAGSVVTSNAATLTVTPPAAPTIARHPAGLTIATGNTAVFSVGVTANPAPAYQWLRDGAVIDGATSATLVLSGVTGATAAIAGNYTVRAQNTLGSATSNGAALTVVPSPDPGHLVNLSILTSLQAGEKLTMGTAIGGGGTSGSKPLVARAAGPALTQLGLTGVLPDPTMKLNNTTGSPFVVDQNNDWGGNANLSAAFASVGAFAFASATSRDAAIYQQALSPGNYTVEVNDNGAGTGTVIAELYDATPAGVFSPSTPRLINVSVLKTIAATGSLTAGFYVGGSTARTVLIRVVGPGLAAVGVTNGTLADPQLTLFNASQATIAANNDWGGDPQLTAVGGRVGAFAVTNAASKDAMLVVTLAPGLYTAQASPVPGSAGGLAIVEVYEVP